TGRSSVGAAAKGDPVRSFSKPCAKLPSTAFRASSAVTYRNLSTIRGRHNPPKHQNPIWCAAKAQRAFGSGNGDCEAAPAGFGFFTLFGFMPFALGGGPAGCSSANTGLGSVTVVADVERSPGLWMTWTCTVAGWNLFSVYCTEKPASGAATETEQGVLQPGPSEVFASAPGGWDSSWTWIVGGVDLK